MRGTEMKKVFSLLFYGVICLVLFCGLVWGLNSKSIPPPYDKIDDSDVMELNPKLMEYEEYSKQDFEDQKQYSGMWSTLHQINLDSLKISVVASSVLKGYTATSLIDKKVDTAWVDGISGDGINEWFSIKLDAKRDSPDATFTIAQFYMIPGYAKSQKTWKENNRVKTALLIIHSPKASFSEYIVCRLQFVDTMKLQVFTLPLDLMVPNYPMSKTVWLVIEDVYKGTKYSDTCISEVAIEGSCLP
jgi:hypothetical protein